MKPKTLNKIQEFLFYIFILYIILLFYTNFAKAQTLLLEDHLDGSISPSWNQLPTSQPAGFTHYAPFTSATPWVTSPTFEGSGAVRYYVLQGTNEHTPWQIGFDTPTAFGVKSLDEMCIEWHEYFELNYPWATGSQKTVRLGYYTDAELASKKTSSLLIQNLNTAITLTYACGAAGDTSLCNVDGMLQKEELFPMGRWVTLKLHTKLNTPGVPNGVLELYKDGVIYLSGSGLNMRGNDTLGYNFFWLGGNYSQTGGIGTLARNGNRYIDWIRVWDKCPGSVVTTTSSTTTTTKPSTTSSTTTTTSTRTTTTLSQCQKDLKNAQLHCK